MKRWLQEDGLSALGSEENPVQIMPSLIYIVKLIGRKYNAYI